MGVGGHLLLAKQRKHQVVVANMSILICFGKVGSQTGSREKPTNLPSLSGFGVQGSFCAHLYSPAETGFHTGLFS